MKRISLVFILIILLLSCQQADLQFSCDPVIDTYVTKNLKELAQLTVFDISVYETSLQRAIFNSWDAEKKRNAWLDKLNFILENELHNDAEASHIQDLIDHIYPGYFLEETIQNEKEFRSDYMAGWISSASNNLGWSKEYIAFIIYRLYISYTQMEAEISVLNNLENQVIINSEEGDCDCSTVSDYCINANCTANQCTSVPSGCGHLWQYACNGRCPE